MSETPTYRPTVAEVVDKLQRLDSADQIAYFLESQDIRGQRKKAYSCPLAVYIGRETGQVISASHAAIVAHGKVGLVELNGIGPLPEFMAYFDEGTYPDLVA